MKIKSTIILLCSLLLVSCGSDELTKSKAEAIAKECESKAETTAYNTTKFRYGEKKVTAADKAKNPEIMDQYRTLEELGLIKINSAGTLGGAREKGESFEVLLTDEGRKLLVGKEEDFLGSLSGNFKIYEYEFQKVKEIQEIPERNEAKVQLIFERTNETPFFENENEADHPKEIIKTMIYRKTNVGWRLCD